MRLRLLALTSVLSVAAFVACEDDTGTAPSPTFDPDSGTYDPADAATPDAATPDAAKPTDDSGVVDKDAEPPVSTDVTVHVLNAFGPVSGVTIVFHDASGAVIGTAKTDAAGTAKSTGATPAQVTALLGGESAHMLTTWTSVKAGDELYVTDIKPPPSQTGTVGTQLPGPYANAGTYMAWIGPCTTSSEDPAEPLTVYLEPRCVRAKSSVLAAAWEGTAPSAYAFVKDVTFDPDAGNAQVALGAWAASTPFAVKAAHLPIDKDTRAGLVQIAGQVGYPTGEGNLGEVPISLPFAGGFADALQPFAVLSEGSSLRTLVARIPTTQSSAEFDFATLLPRITDAAVDHADPVHPSVSWTSEAPLTGTNGGIASITYSDNRDTILQWRFIVPASATSIKAPSLPEDAADWAPIAGDGGMASSNFWPPSVLFVASPLFTGDQAFRRDAARFDPAYLESDRPIGDALLPANGTLRATALRALVD